MKKDSTPKPYRQLVPVIMVLALNLAAYLYVMSVNLKGLNLVTPTPKDISNLIVVGSYILTALAMLLTLVSYITIKAYLKRIKGEDPAPKVPELKVVDRDKKGKKIEVADKDQTEKKVQSSKTSEETKTEPKLPAKPLAPLVESGARAATMTQAVAIAGINKNWKKIGIKIPDEPIDDNNLEKSKVGETPVKTHELVKEKLEAPTPNVKENIHENIVSSTIEVADKDQKLSDPKIKTISPNQSQEKLGNEANPTSPVTQTPQQEVPQHSSESVENVPTIVEGSRLESNSDESIEEYYDSEIIRTMEELKQIVDEMKYTIKKKQKNSTPT
jgi:hypothetical protein